MAVDFVVEDGSGLATATSFCSVARADELLATVSGTAAWQDLDAPTKEARLIEATRLLHDRPRWRGSRSWPERQRLAYPRSGLYDQDGEEIDWQTMPEWLQLATALWAHRLHTGEASSADDAPVASVSMGALSVSYAQPSRGAASVPESVLSLIRPYIRTTVSVVRC